MSIRDEALDKAVVTKNIDDWNIFKKLRNQKQRNMPGMPKY